MFPCPLGYWVMTDWYLIEINWDLLISNSLLNNGYLLKMLISINILTKLALKTGQSAKFDLAAKFKMADQMRFLIMIMHTKKNMSVHSFSCALQLCQQADDWSREHTAPSWMSPELGLEWMTYISWAQCMMEGTFLEKGPLMGFQCCLGYSSKSHKEQSMRNGLIFVKFHLLFIDFIAFRGHIKISQFFFNY